MLKAMLKKCQEMLEVQSASIFLKHEFTGELVHQVGFDGGKELKMKQALRPGAGAAGRVAAEGKSLMLNQAEQLKGLAPEEEWPKELEVRNYLASPIRIGSQVMGVIRVLNRREGGFRKADQVLLEEVARSVGIALRNLELYLKLEHSVEETIQVNQMLNRANAELEMKTRELEALRRKGKA
jgi:GAF domain-containing protein